MMFSGNPALIRHRPFLKILPSADVIVDVPALVCPMRTNGPNHRASDAIMALENTGMWHGRSESSCFRCHYGS